MKISIIYDNIRQILEVETDELIGWLNIDVEPNLSDEVLQKIVQEKIDKEFNRPEYNNWHKFDRHRGMPKRAYRRDYEAEDETDIMDSFGDYTQETERNNRYEYDALCQLIHNSLKPSYADVLIAICLDSKTPEEYAIENGEKRDAVYKRLQRAKKKFLKILEKCPIQ